MTDNEFQTLNAQNNERALEIAKILIKAAKETHAVIVKSEAKSKKAKEAIAMHDKEVMWRILQEYIEQYAGFISKTSALTGVGLCKADRDFYNRITVADIENQIQIIIGFVHAKEAFDSVVKETYKQCVEKHLKRSPLFSSNELKHLFM